MSSQNTAAAGLQATHEEACRRFSSKKDQPAQAKQGQKTKPKSRSKPALAPAPQPKSQTKHEVVREAAEYTDEALAKLSEALKVDENDVGPYAKGLLKQALSAVSAAKDKMIKIEKDMRDMDERMTALEDYIIQQQDDEVDDFAEKVGAKLGKMLASLT